MTIFHRIPLPAFAGNERHTFSIASRKKQDK